MSEKPPARRTHREYVESKAAEAVRPTPTPLTKQLIEENTLESCEKLRCIEMLFTSLSDMPGLRVCGRLQELTIMHARLVHMPSELQTVKGTLRRLSLATNEIRAIEHLEGMTKLHSLFLHDNRITSFGGLGGCPGLQRLWLSTNQLTSAASLPASKLAELRELWLQANPLEAVDGLPALRNLQILSLAGTRIRSLEQLAPLVELPCLFDLAFEDGYYGAAPIVDEPSYRASALRSLKQLGVLDGRSIVERQRSDAEEEFLQRSLRFNVEVERLKVEATANLAALDRERQASAAGLRAMRTAHARSVAQLHALISSGRAEVQRQEEDFVQAYKASRRELRRSIGELRKEYDAELERIAAVERTHIRACRRRLALLKARSAALAATREAIASAELGGDGRLYAEPVDQSDPLFAFVRARVEAQSEPAAQREAGPTLHMLCCLRLYRVAATAAAANAAAAAASAAAATGHAPGTSHSSAASHYRGVWWWYCAPLNQLLTCASRWVPRAPNQLHENGGASRVGSAGHGSAGGVRAPGGHGKGAPRKAQNGGAYDEVHSEWFRAMTPELFGEASVEIDTSKVLSPAGKILGEDESEDESEEEESDEEAGPGEEDAEDQKEGEEEGEEEEEEEEEGVEGEEAAAAAHGEEVVEAAAKVAEESGKGGKGGKGDPKPPIKICAALLCRASSQTESAGGAAGATTSAAVDDASSAASAAPEYLVMYEASAPSVDGEMTVEEEHRKELEGLVGMAGLDLIGNGLPPQAAPHATSGMGTSGGTSSEKHGKGSKAASSAAAAPPPQPPDHVLLEALLEGEPPPREFSGPHPKGETSKDREGRDKEGKGREAAPTWSDAVALAKAAAAEEEAASIASAARGQRRATRQALSNATLLQLERRADDAFRAHEHRVWKVAHPETAQAVEANTARIRGLQTQLGQLYEQIRGEHAQQLQLRAQIEARTAPTVSAAASRGEAMLSTALKAARSSIILAAAAHDGGDGATDGADVDGDSALAEDGAR